MKGTIVILVLAIVNAEAADRNRLQVRPIGMKNFKLEMYMGKWYHYAHIVSCSWKGSAQFNDWWVIQNMDSNGQSFTIEETWRKDGTCTTTGGKATMKSTAIMNAVDQIGDLWSGTLIIVYMDYINYVITWGCVNKSVHSGVCDDFYVGVKTRKPKISQEYIDEINQKLNQMWGTSLSEMELKSHNNPCGQPVSRLDRRLKTY